MLLITRKVGESVTLGDRIVVKVVDVQGKKVQLAIDAPKDVVIGRAPPAESVPDRK